MYEPADDRVAFDLRRRYAHEFPIYRPLEAVERGPKIGGEQFVHSSPFRDRGEPPKCTDTATSERCCDLLVNEGYGLVRNNYVTEKGCTGDEINFPDGAAESRGRAAVR